MIEVHFAGGCHGNFLCYALHHLAGISPTKRSLTSVYDQQEYGNEIIFKEWDRTSPIDLDNSVFIKIPDDHIPQFVMLNINRTAGYDLILEQLHIDTKTKVLNHNNLIYFYDSLVAINGSEQEEYSKPIIREWIRLSLLDPTTIKGWTHAVNSRQARCNLDLSDFYHEDRLLAACKVILMTFDIPILRDDMTGIYQEFRSKLRYGYIMPQIQSAMMAIERGQDQKLDFTNIVQEAALDRFLEERYGVSPALLDDYFISTGEILDRYQIGFSPVR